MDDFAEEKTRQDHKSQNNPKGANQVHFQLIRQIAQPMEQTTTTTNKATALQTLI